MAISIKLTRQSLLSLLLMVSLPLFAADDEALSTQREDFRAAERAFAAGELSRYRRLAGRLVDYPLYPYLRYERLKRNISPAKGGEIARFLDEYSQLPIAGFLRNRWLKELARGRQWQEYARIYRPTESIPLQCHYYRALLVNGDQQQAWQGARTLWLHGRSRPKSCDPLFSAWRQSTDFNEELIWRRLRLALAAGQTGLATYLAKMLPEGEQRVARQMVEVHRRPKKILDCDYWQAPELAAVAAHGVRRLARTDSSAALAIWQARADPMQFAPDDYGTTLNRLVLELALSGHDLAEEFLDATPASLLDETSSEWRMRWALGAGRWRHLLNWYEQLGEVSRESTRWRYWRARALQMEGDQPQANTELTSLATQRDYYGFLAADHLGQPYQYQQNVPQITPTDLARMANTPAMRRVVELRHFNRETEARREWWYSLNGTSKEHREVAAKLAQQWGWHPLAVLTAASAQSWNDLELRFPRLYQGIVKQQAEVQQLPVELINGLIRRESIFDPTARSRVGARGLMQLMPATARKVARSRKETWRSLSALSRPELNIRYGSHYLRQMLDRFNGHKVLALAAYNGGPHNVNRWLRKRSSAPADLWTELITYGETRDYVQAVLSYAVIYRQLNGEPALRLSELAPPIALTPPAGQAELPSADTSEFVRQAQFGCDQ
ncbi:MAG: transglycosylase SLT domain-containing protein [Gammaproteobacteria bacterium]